MKYLWELIVLLLQFSALAMILALLYGGARHVLSIFHVVEQPTWLNIFGMAMCLFIVMLACGLVGVIVFLYRCHKYPMFKQAAFQTGMDWKTYKRLTNDRKRR